MVSAERVAKITTIVDHRGAKEVAIDAFHLVYTATTSVAYNAIRSLKVIWILLLGSPYSLYCPELLYLHAL
jgi:hypothetical protein